MKGVSGWSYLSADQGVCVGANRVKGVHQKKRKKSEKLAIDTIDVENEVADNMYQRSELDYLIYNDPIGYADLVLNGSPETYLKTVTEYKPVD